MGFSFWFYEFGFSWCKGKIKNNQNFNKSFTYCSTGHPLTAEFGLISFGVGAILSFASILPCTMYVKKRNNKKNSSKDLGLNFQAQTTLRRPMVEWELRIDLIYWPSQCFSSFNWKINSEGVFWLLCGTCFIFTRFFFGECPIHVCLFVQGWDLSFAWRIKSVFAEFPVLLMRHEAIEMVCAHVGQGREPPSRHSDVLGVSATDS